MAKASSAKTINPDEAAHFGSLAADWWDPKGSSGMLHKLNPVRLGFVRAQVDAHFGSMAEALKPLAGKSVLDVGCGAGLLCEPLARLGADVTGVDAATENIAAAKQHAGQSGLDIDYRAGELSEILPTPPFASSEVERAARASRVSTGLDTNGNENRFDLVTAMEVIEHVNDPADFLGQLKERMRPDGLLILSTPNRTAASKLLLVEAAERFGQIPRGTHHWDQFITPEEMTAMFADAGLQVTAMQGIAFSPLRGLHLSSNTALNYILSARFIS